MMPLLALGLGAFIALGLLTLAFAQPANGKMRARRMDASKQRHSVQQPSVERELRKIMTKPAPTSEDSDSLFAKFIPTRPLVTQRLMRTGTQWTVDGYYIACGSVFVLIAGMVLLQGGSALVALLLGGAGAIFLPHKVVDYLIARRIRLFVTRFPEAIELMVRGLRSGLPISKTLQIVAEELKGPVSEEFQVISDTVRIGRTMDEALQLVADKLGVPEFQFFCISITIQRETGGNLAETLSNLADVLRKRAQMKLKIKAMSAEVKASAGIIGALPFIIFGMIYSINPGYMGQFFIDDRLIIIGSGAFLWMCIGGFVMAKMASFEI